MGQLRGPPRLSCLCCYLLTLLVIVAMTGCAYVQRAMSGPICQSRLQGEDAARDASKTRWRTARDMQMVLYGPYDPTKAEAAVRDADKAMDADEAELRARR